MLTAESLHEWATKNVTGIKTLFANKKGIVKTALKLKSRFNKAKTIAGTQTFHHFNPVSKREMLVKRMTSSNNHEIKVIV